MKYEKARIAEDQRTASFTISLLTVGVGGAVAGALVKSGVAKATAGTAYSSEATAKSLGKTILVDAMKQPLDAGSKALTGWFQRKLQGVLCPQIDEEPFSPCGLNPVEYGNTLNESILRQLGVLQGMKKAFAEAKVEPGYPLEVGRAFCATILSDSMIVEKPADAEYSRVLKASAEIGLWRDWARRRNYDYWKNRRRSPVYSFEAAELRSWDPLVARLSSLGLPTSLFTFKDQMASTLGGKTIRDMDMVGLMNWAVSADAFNRVFAGVPKSKWRDVAMARFFLDSFGRI